MTSFRFRAVLVTGASGFVGAHLTRALQARGVVVHGLGAESPHDSLPLASWHTADLRSIDALAEGLGAAAPEAIVHLAGQASAGKSFQQPRETFQVNALGTWNLIEATRRAAPRARLLVIGSGETYGPQPAGSRVAEEAPLRPVSPYALSKAAADVCAEIAAGEGLDVVRTRSFSHTGPGQAPTFVVPSWAQQIAAIERGEAEPVLKVGNLDVTRDLSDVRDVVLAYLALLERGRTGAAYNVCRGEGVTLASVVERLAARAAVPIRIEVDPERVRPVDVEYLVGDPGAAERDAGWRPAIDLDRTLEDVLADWRAHAGKA